MLLLRQFHRQWRQMPMFLRQPKRFYTSIKKTADLFQHQTYDQCAKQSHCHPVKSIQQIALHKLLTNFFPFQYKPSFLYIHIYLHFVLSYHILQKITRTDGKFLVGFFQKSIPNDSSAYPLYFYPAFMFILQILAESNMYIYS